MNADPLEGFIEVVGDAETICKIQMAAQRSFKSTAAFRRGLLLEWIIKHNPGPEQGGDSIVYVANICVSRASSSLRFHFSNEIFFQVSLEIFLY